MTLDPFLSTSGDRPFYGAMVERRDSPSWLCDDDDVNFEQNFEPVFYLVIANSTTTVVCYVFWCDTSNCTLCIDCIVDLYFWFELNSWLMAAIPSGARNFGPLVS